MEFLTSIPFLITANILFGIYLLIGNTLSYTQAVSATGRYLQNSISKKKIDAGIQDAGKPTYQRTTDFVSPHAHVSIKPNDYDAFFQRQEAEKEAYDRLSAQDSINSKIKRRIQARWMLAIKIIGILLLSGNIYKLNQILELHPDL